VYNGSEIAARFYTGDPDDLRNVTKYAWDFKFNGNISSFTSNTSEIEVTHVFTIPGDHTIGLKIWNETNETAGKIVSFKIHVFGPDLTIKISPKISPNRANHKGDTIKIIVNVTNVGELDAKNITVKLIVKFYNDTKSDQKIIPELKANQSINITLRWKSTLDGGLIKYSIVVDPEDKILETNETNNIWNLTTKSYVDRVLILPSIFCGCLILLIIIYIVVNIMRQKRGKKPIIDW
jgi:hypothetical protein